MQYVLALLGIAFGAFMVIKTEWLIQNFGTSDWAESKMGTSGGSRLLYKLIGLAIIFLCLMGLTGQLGGFLMGTVGKLFGPR